MIENHVTSKDLSERLKALGVPQISYFKWGGKDGNELHYCLEDIIDFTNCSSAYLSSEIGNWLPKEFDLPKKLTTTGEWVYFVGSNLIGGNLTECEARGLLLEYLILNGFISVKDLN